MTTLRIYLEQAAKRTFAGAVDWPGLERSGRDADAAREALLRTAPRYRAALGRAAADLPEPAGPDELETVEVHDGGSGTEFGVPSQGPATDEAAVDDAELARLTGILEAAWRAFDEAAAAAEGVELTKGPRGGGRELDRIREHVREAERAYLRQIGGALPAAAVDDLTAIRTAAIEALGARARGEPFEMGRRTAPLWTPRYFVRRSAWHALDHAWEIEDRSRPSAG